MKKLRLPIALVLLALVLFIAWTLFGGRVMDWYYQSAADKAIAAGDPIKAADLLSKRLASTPRNTEMRLQVCDLYIEGGNISRAEHILQKGLTEAGPNAALYAKLSHVFVLQDKLYDAVRLLDGINSPSAGPEVEALRPALPALSLAPGRYTELQMLEIVPFGNTTVYYSLDDDIPSTETDLYTAPIELQPGLTQLRVLAVDENGMVSHWMTAEYSLEDIVLPVRFADPAVEAVLRDAIQKPNGYLYTDDFWGIDEIVVSEPGAYRTLSDFALCTGLKRLELTGDHTGCDISSLESMTQLETLTLREMGITSLDLPVFENLTNLQVLDLSQNGIGDASALGTLTLLRELNLSSNSLLEISALSNLTALTRLDLSQNALSDAAPLRTLTALESLSLADNRIRMLSGFSSLRQLVDLDVSGQNELSSVAEIFTLPALQSLKAENCGLENLPEAESVSLPSLTELYLSGNRITAVSALRGALALETLYIENNAVESLSPLAESASLKDIYAAGNKLEAVEDVFIETDIKVHLD